MGQAQPVLWRVPTATATTASVNMDTLTVEKDMDMDMDTGRRGEDMARNTAMGEWRENTVTVITASVNMDMDTRDMDVEIKDIIKQWANAMNMDMDLNGHKGHSCGVDSEDKLFNIF